MEIRVIIKDVYRLSKDKYEFTVEVGGRTLKYDVHYRNIGWIMKRVLTKLRVDEGELYPPSIPNIPASMEYMNSEASIVIKKIEANSNAIISSVNEYLSRDESVRNEIVADKDTDYTLVMDSMPNMTSYTAYIRGTVESVIDGDTVWVNVSEVNNVKHAKGEGNDLIGESLKIRLAGVDTRELDRGDYESKDSNISWLKENGLYVETDKEDLIAKTFEMAEEAKKFLRDQVEGEEVTILIDNHPENEMDEYERLIGIIYIHSDVDNYVYNAINLNKSLLASESKSFKGKSLGESSVYYSDFGGEVTSIFDVSEWWVYSIDAEERRNEIEEAKVKTNASTLEDFVDKHNLVLDNHGKILYNEIDEKQIETRSYLVKEPMTLTQLVEEIGRGKTYYTTRERIAFANGYELDTSSLSVDLQKGNLVGRSIEIPIFEKNYEKAEEVLDGRFPNNKNNIPADSAHEDYANPLYDDRDRLDRFDRTKYTIDEIDDIYDGGYTRIGDCTLVIPPLSIKVDTLGQNKSTPTLRSKSSMQTQTGHSTKIVTMELFFSDLEEINGIREEDPNLNPLIDAPDQYKQDWYRNGLRPLIAQFKKAPFLPVENNLLNDNFGIFSVALKDIQLSTLPGFPGAIKATLVMYEFDHNSYMFDSEDFAASFNWKMFRWYYQEVMQERSKYQGKTYLESMDQLDDYISFYILKEEELAKRQEAIREVDESIDPMLYAKTNTSPNTETGKRIIDGSRIDGAKEQKKAFDAWLRKHPADEYPLFYKDGVFNFRNEDAAWNDYKYLRALTDMISVVYFDGEKIHVDDSRYETPNKKYEYEVTTEFLEDDVRKAYFVPNNINSIREFFSRTRDIGTNGRNVVINNDYIDFGIPPTPTMTSDFKGYSNYHRNQSWFDDVDRGGGFFNIKLQALENKIKVPPTKIYAKNSLEEDKEVYYSVFSSSEDIVEINKVKTRGQSAKDSLVNYQVEYENLKNTANMDESQIGTRLFEIGEDFWIESISASLSNNLTPIQLTENEAPTFQFLGSQDTDFSMTIRTTSKSVLSKFRNLVSETQRLAREYRIGITSGILSIENNILKLMGVQDVLIQSISVETITDDKESYRITLNLKGFDKEQSGKEKLGQEDIGDQIKDMDTFKDFSKERRADENFEYASVDFALKDAELYPDMELPTFEELNSVLPYLKIRSLDGGPYVHIYNPSGAKYVDPDFYIRSATTTREIIADLLENDTPAMYLKDNSGFEAVELGPRPDSQGMERPDIQFSPQTKEWINNNLETVDMGRVQLNGDLSESSGLYAEFYSNRLTEESAEKLDQTYNDNSVLTSNLKDYLYKAANAHIRAKEIKTYGFRNFTVERVEESIREVMDKPSTTNQKTNIKNPEYYEVSKEIDKLVNEVFPDIIYDNEVDESNYSFSRTYTYGPSRISAPIITKQKISNVIKAMIEVESGWQQFETYEGKIIPFIDSYGNVGISGININSRMFTSRDKIIEAAYDWKKNLRLGVEFFAFCYNKAIDKGNDPGDNPLDWAIGLYENGKGNKIPETSSVFIDVDIDNNGYYNQVINKFAIKYGSSQAMINATPVELVSNKLVDFEESKNRIDNLYKLLYLNTLSGRKFDSSNESDYALLKRILGKIVDVDSSSLDFIKAIPVPNPQEKKVYADSRYAQTKNDSSRGKTLKKVDTSVDLRELKSEDISVLGENAILSKAGTDLFYSIMTIDPYGEFEKANNNKNALPNWGLAAGIQSTQIEVPVDNRLYFILAKHFEMRFQDKVNFTTAEKYSMKKYGTKLDNTSTFDFTSNVIVLKKNAFNNMVDMYDYAKEDGTNDGFNLFDIDWDKIYTLVDISGETEDSKEAVKELGTDLNKIEIGAFFRRNHSEIAESFRTSFNDILEYDHKGRLVRAFPTFHMFLIHEGRWMLWHKLWDNFYGYNSISSIDIVKDRRIAANTAVIEMSNIYHNLNTDDDQTSFGEFSQNIGDLILGSSEDRAKVVKNIFNLPDEEVIRARAENINSLVLKPGARIHLRMGYGSDALSLPVAFNGTITEMNTEEMCTVIAQGDGLELTNKLNVDPDATTDPGLFSSVKEPREMICEILTSKGGFFTNILNEMTGKVFFNKHPLGIAHFGNTIAPPGLHRIGLLNPVDIDVRDWGEAGLNVYSGAGYNTFSQWMHTHGEKKGESIGMSWGDGLFGLPWAKGDEPNVQIYLFDKTPWDIFQVYSAVCPDYISAVHPFEYRSTLFFGRPTWGLIDKYEYEYLWDPDKNYVKREPKAAYRKAYSQTHIYNGSLDIISNGIKASATNMYTNVIGIYNEADGAKKTKPVMVDSDIYPQFQRTATVHMPIQASKYNNYWTQDKYALAAATSQLRDYVKDMYQGELVVMGDPSVKPYDNMYIDDNFADMRGLTEVKRVVHSMSYETGFITSITPDCISVIDDAQTISKHTWVTSTATSVVAVTAGHLVKNKAWKYFIDTTIVEAIRRYSVNGAEFLMERLIDSKMKSAFKDAVLEGKGFNAKKEILLARKTAKDNLPMWKRLITETINGEYNKGIKAGSKEALDQTKSILAKAGYEFSDEVAGKIHSVADAFKEIYKNPSYTDEVIDKIWDASKILDNKHWFKNKGLIRRTSNFLLRNTSKVVKFGAKTTGKVTAKGARAIGWLMKHPQAAATLGNIAITAGLTIICANLVERYRRFLGSRQALTIIPLTYRGKSFTAGLDGHQGSIVGDSPSKIDKFFMGTGFAGDVVKAFNWYNDIDIDYNSDAKLDD